MTLNLYLLAVVLEIFHADKCADSRYTLNRNYTTVVLIIYLYRTALSSLGLSAFLHAAHHTCKTIKLHWLISD